MRFAAGPEELLPREELLRLSGLAFLQGIRDGRYPAPPICQTLDFWMTEAERGRVAFRGQPRFAAMNPIGSIHGGWFGTLLDSCMACAVQSMLPAGRAYTTLDYGVRILRALGPDSGTVEAVGTVVRVGRRTGVAEGRLAGVTDGRVYATGSTTCLILDDTPPA